jgi:hypothetical protein
MARASFCFSGGLAAEAFFSRRLFAAGVGCPFAGDLTVPRQAQGPQTLGPCADRELFLLIFLHGQSRVPRPQLSHTQSGCLLFCGFRLASHAVTFCCDKKPRV